MALGSREAHSFVHCRQQPCNHKFYRGRFWKKLYTHRQEQGNNQTGDLTLHRKNTVQVSTETMAKSNKTGMLALRSFVSLLSIGGFFVVLIFCFPIFLFFFFALTLAFGLNCLSSLDLFWSYCNAITVENVL